MKPMRWKLRVPTPVKKIIARPVGPVGMRISSTVGGAAHAASAYAKILRVPAVGAAP